MREHVLLFCLLGLVLTATIILVTAPGAVTCALALVERCDALQKVRFWDPEHWRFRAEETRTVADQMTHEESRTIMRRIANDYDRLAKLAEEKLADQERGAIGDKT